MFVHKRVFFPSPSWLLTSHGEGSWGFPFWESVHPEEEIYGNLILQNLLLFSQIREDPRRLSVFVDSQWSLAQYNPYTKVVYFGVAPPLSPHPQCDCIWSRTCKEVIKIK